MCGNQRYCGLGKPDPPSCVTTLPAPSGPPHANVAERPTVTDDCPRAFAHCSAFPSPGCPPWGKAMASGPRRYLGAVGSASASHARVQNSLGRAKHSNVGGLATTAAQGRCSPRDGDIPHRRWAHAGDPLLAARGAPQECRARIGYSLTTSAQMQGRCALPLPPPSGPAPSKGRNRGASRLARNRRQHALNGNVDQTHGHALPRDFLIPGARLPRLARLGQLEKSAPREVGGWRAP